MDMTNPQESVSIGLNGDAYAAITPDFALSALRTCLMPSEAQRTYSSVELSAIPNGQTLYVRQAY